MNNQPNQPLFLGARSRPKDTRDYHLGSYQAPVSIPDVYETDISKVKFQFQFQWPSCGAHSGTHFKELQESLTKDGVQAFSPCFLWDEIKKIDGFPPEMGTDMRSILQTLKNIGVCDYELLPDNYTLSLARYTNQPLTAEMVENAEDKRISSYAFSDNPSVQDVKQAIFQNKVVLLLIYCDDGFWRIPQTYTQKKYGHFVVAYAYDETNIKIIDSTEENNHLKLIPTSAISFIRELGTAVDLSNATYTFQKDMNYGNISNDVKELQKKLISLGYSIPDGPTNYFGPQTRKALISFQDDNHIQLTWSQRYIPWSAVAGPLTRQQLNSM